MAEEIEKVTPPVEPEPAPQEKPAVEVSAPVKAVPQAPVLYPPW